MADGRGLGFLVRCAEPRTMQTLRMLRLYLVMDIVDVSSGTTMQSSRHHLPVLTDRDRVAGRI